MSCENCKNEDVEFDKIKKAAKADAYKTQISMAVWKEGSTWTYGSATDAIASGKPIADILSFYQPTAST